MTTTSKPIIADSEPESRFPAEQFADLTPGEALDLWRQLEQIAADTREYVPIGWRKS